MRKLLFIFLSSLFIQSLHAQNSSLLVVKKFVNRMFFSKDTSRKPSFVLLPALSSSPETGLEVGGAALLSFYSDTLLRDTRVSSVFGYATVTTKGQTKLSLNASYWEPHNKFHYTGTIGFYNYPYDFYGVGNDTRLSNVQHVNEKRYKAATAGEILFGKSIYVGYVAGFIKYFYKYDENESFIQDPNIDVQDRHGGSNLYIGPSFTLDTRNNNTYTTKGIIINAYYNITHGIYTNNSYAGGFFNVEYSQFFLIAKPLVLGFDIQEQSLTGSRSPFYLLPELGSDEMMRGYYEGRYRDRNFLAGQTELRYRISGRFGVAGFVGTGEVFHTSFKFPGLKPDYGGGIRYFFDIQKGLAIRLDYGVGQKPAGEPRQSGFYIALGQSF